MERKYTEEDLRHAFISGCIYTEWENKSLDEKYKPKTIEEFIEHLNK